MSRQNINRADTALGQTIIDAARDVAELGFEATPSREGRQRKARWRCLVRSPVGEFATEFRTLHTHVTLVPRHIRVVFSKK